MISLRTPGGAPNRCPICAAAIHVEPSNPPGDAPCPNCGTLLWFSKTPDGLWFYDEETARPIRRRILDLICDNLGVNKEQLTYDLSFAEVPGVDSLDLVEFIMEIEEELEIAIPDEDAAKIKTIRDLIDYLLRHGL